MDTNKARKGLRGLITPVLLIIIILLLIYILLHGGVACKCNCCCSEKRGNGNASQSSAFALEIDPNTAEPHADSKEEIVGDLNQKVDHGFITISMNATPVFTDGGVSGNLQIVNSGKNNFPQVVQIVDNATGTLLYESGLIPVGQGVEYASLIEQLPAGRYPCTAIFHNVDPESGLSLGRAQAAIEIVVTN